MLDTLRAAPRGVRLFLLYALGILAFIGVTLPRVVEQAVAMPISPIGIVWMLLLAYTIFTVTLVLERRQAAYLFALGLCSLTLPGILVLGLGAGLIGAALGAVFAALLFHQMTRLPVRRFFDQP